MLRVVGIEIDGTGNVTGVPLLGEVTVEGCQVDGGKDLIYKPQRTHIVPAASGVVGNVSMFVPSLRCNPLLRRSQKATMKLGLAAYCAASKAASVTLTGRLICYVVSDDNN